MKWITTRFTLSPMMWWAVALNLAVALMHMCMFIFNFGGVSSGILWLPNLAMVGWMLYTNHTKPVSVDNENVP